MLRNQTGETEGLEACDESRASSIQGGSSYTFLLVAALWVLCMAVAPYAGATEPARLELVERSEEELLILSLEVATYLLSDGILAFLDERGILLPLRQLTDSLELPIHVDIAGGRAHGWVMDPKQEFSMDFKSKTVTLDGVEQELSTDALMEAHRDDLYVGSELLARCWPVEIDLDLARLRAVLVSELPLPIESRLDRRAKWRRMDPRGGGSPVIGSRTIGSQGIGAQPERAGFPPLSSPYRSVDWPAIDGRLDVAWRRSSAGESSRLAQYSTLAQGDLLGMTANLFWSGAEKNGSHQTSSRRLSLSRTDTEAGLLGPLGASEVRVGDLLSLGHPLITHGRGGRGISLERSRIRHGSQFGSTILRGDALPGWDIELYRGSQLLAFQTIGADGQYEFQEIPLVIGRNELRVRMFGPHGEEREELESILVGAGALPPGEIRYRAHVVEQGRGLLAADVEVDSGFSESDSRAGPGQGPGEGEIVLGGNFEYGLTRRWMTSAGALSLPIEAKQGVGRHSYAWFGLEGSLLGTASLFEVVRDFEGGWAGRIAAQRRLGGVGFRFEHRQYLSFASELIQGPELVSRSELRVDSHIPLRGRARIPFSLLYTLAQRENESVFRARGETSYTTRLGSVRLANRWAVETESGQFSARGRTTLHGRLGRFPVRGRLAYEVWPQIDLVNLNLDVRWEDHNRFSAALGFDYDLETRVARLRAGLEWQTQRQVLGMALEAGSDSSLSLQLSTRFSLRRDSDSQRYQMRTDAPASQGVVKAFVFLDVNGNGSFDLEDEALPNVAFELDGGRHPVATNEDGLAYLVMASHRRVDLAVAEGSLEDPYWLSSRPGVEILTRPGRTEFVEFPIVATGEIDGTVYLIRDEGKMKIGGVKLDLFDLEGHLVSRVESQYDGFYLFEKILPGKYSLRISPASLDLWSPNQGEANYHGEQRQVTLGPDLLAALKPVDLVIDFGTIKAGVDFHLALPSL